MKVPIEISARHIHLSQKDLDKLFAKDYQLTKLKKLSQTGEFAAKEMVQIIGKNYAGNRVRIVGPVRPQTQIEMSRSDAIRMGLDNIPLRLSGDLKGVSKIKVVGSSGQIVQAKAIVAKRHLHCSTIQAKKNRLRNNQKIKVRIRGNRAVVFENVIVRVRDNYNLALHIDTDEGNAAGLGRVKKNKSFGELILK